MTEVKWSILFLAFFIIISFGLDYKIQMEKGLTITEIQYNLQLDTCLTDTLRCSELGRRNGESFFYSPDRVRKELTKQLTFAGLGSSEYREGEGDGGIVLLILYEPDGFYFYEPGMGAISEKTVFYVENGEERLSKLEMFMEERLRIQLEAAEKNGTLCFTFPKEERASYAQTIKGTGLLLVYEAAELRFKERPYERFILSGARVEEAP